MAKRTHNREQREKNAPNRRMLYIGLIAIAAIAVVAILIYFGNFSGKSAATTRPNAVGMSMGDVNAPVKVEEFSDFQCPACRGFFLDSIQKVLETYCSQNKVCVVYHEFPLKNHNIQFA